MTLSLLFINPVEQYTSGVEYVTEVIYLCLKSNRVQKADDYPEYSLVKHFL
jgi:hypothetical protein